MALLLLLAKVALASLPTACFVALRPLLLLQQAQYIQVSLLKPVSFCKLSTGLVITNKSATSFLFSDFRSDFASLFSLSFLLPQTLWQELSSLTFLLSGYNGSPDTRFFRGKMQLISWPDDVRYSCLCIPL